MQFGTWSLVVEARNVANGSGKIAYLAIRAVSFQSFSDTTLKLPQYLTFQSVDSLI